MENLISNTLFRNIAGEELTTLFACLNVKRISAKKGEFLLLAGDAVRHIGIVTDGQLHVMKEDSDGERTILSSLSKGDYYGETLCFAEVPESPVSVIAETDAEVLLLDCQKILHPCSHSCAYHTQFMENMVLLLAQKNLMLQNRMEHLSKKSIRRKILSYLSSFESKKGKQFSIPFNREEWADYLCVDRTALSHELSRMKEEGILTYRKNHFTLY